MEFKMLEIAKKNSYKINRENVQQQKTAKKANVGANLRQCCGDRRKVRTAGETFEGFRGGGACRSGQAELDSTRSTQNSEEGLTRPAPFGALRDAADSNALRIPPRQARKIGGLEAWMLGSLEA